MSKRPSRVREHACLCISASLALTLAVITAPAHADGHAWSVNMNKAVGVCTMGLAPVGWAARGTANYAAGWRQRSQSYRDPLEAQRTICRWHSHRKEGCVSPDVIDGTIPCAALCGGNPSCQ